MQEIKKYINNHKQTPYVPSFESFQEENLAQFIIAYLGDKGLNRRNNSFIIGRSEYGPWIHERNGSIVWYTNDEGDVTKMPAGTVPQNVMKLLTSEVNVSRSQRLYEELLKLNKRALEYIATNLQGGYQQVNRSKNHRDSITIGPKNYWRAIKPRVSAVGRFQTLQNSAAQRVYAPNAPGFNSAKRNFQRRLGGFRKRTRSSLHNAAYYLNDKMNLDSGGEINKRGRKRAKR